MYLYSSFQCKEQDLADLGGGAQGTLGPTLFKGQTIGPQIQEMLLLRSPPPYFLKDRLNPPLRSRFFPFAISNSRSSYKSG